MNTTDLTTYCDDLVADSAELQQKTMRVTDAYQHIWGWLHAHDLTPVNSLIRPHEEVGFQFVFTFRNYSLVPFARLEKDFWRYVGKYVSASDAVRSFLYEAEPSEPLASVAIRDELWDVVVTPHPDELIEKFPARRFWRGATEVEDAITENRNDSLIEQRTNMVLAALVSTEVCETL